VHVISQNIDGGAIEADGGASAPVVPSVATSLDVALIAKHFINSDQIIEHQGKPCISHYSAFYLLCITNKAKQSGYTKGILYSII